MRHPLQEKVIQARNLPPGHYGRDEVNKEIAREYELCREYEKTKKIPYVRLTDREAAAICALITQRLGIRKIKKLVLNSELADGAIAVYHDREIHFATIYITLITLLHEIAHHIKHEGNFPGTPHGKGFIEAFDLAVDAFRG